jgi:hypothetical protein
MQRIETDFRRSNWKEFQTDSRRTMPEEQTPEHFVVRSLELVADRRMKLAAVQRLKSAVADFRQRDCCCQNEFLVKIILISFEFKKFTLITSRFFFIAKGSTNTAGYYIHNFTKKKSFD